MQDIFLMTQTAHKIMAAKGWVKTVRSDSGRVHFLAGATVLNGQAVADLVNSGWLKPYGALDLFMDTLPPFAYNNPAEAA